MPRGRLLDPSEESQRVTIRLPGEHWDWLVKEAKHQWRTEPEVIAELLRDAIRARIASELVGLREANRHLMESIVGPME
jgi:hypothetical protein